MTSAKPKVSSKRKAIDEALVRRMVQTEKNIAQANTYIKAYIADSKTALTTFARNASGIDTQDLYRDVEAVSALTHSVQNLLYGFKKLDPSDAFVNSLHTLLDALDYERDVYESALESRMRDYADLAGPTSELGKALEKNNAERKERQERRKAAVAQNKGASNNAGLDISRYRVRTPPTGLGTAQNLNRANNQASLSRSSDRRISYATSISTRGQIATNTGTTRAPSCTGMREQPQQAQQQTALPAAAPRATVADPSQSTATTLDRQYLNLSRQIARRDGEFQEWQVEFWTDFAKEFAKGHGQAPGGKGGGLDIGDLLGKFLKGWLAKKGFGSLMDMKDQWDNRKNNNRGNPRTGPNAPSTPGKAQPAPPKKGFLGKVGDAAKTVGKTAVKAIPGVAATAAAAGTVKDLYNTLKSDTPDTKPATPDAPKVTDAPDKKPVTTVPAGPDAHSAQPHTHTITPEAAKPSKMETAKKAFSAVGGVAGSMNALGVASEIYNDWGKTKEERLADVEAKIASAQELNDGLEAMAPEWMQRTFGWGSYRNKATSATQGAPAPASKPEASAVTPKGTPVMVNGKVIGHITDNGIVPLPGEEENLKSIQAQARSMVEGQTGVKAYAQGGVIGDKTVMIREDGSLAVMSEAGPEAILPLVRTPDGDLGVKSIGSGKGQTTATAGGAGMQVAPENLTLELDAQAAQEFAETLVKESRLQDLLEKGMKLAATGGGAKETIKKALEGLGMTLNPDGTISRVGGPSGGAQPGGQQGGGGAAATRSPQIVSERAKEDTAIAAEGKALGEQHAAAQAKLGPAREAVSKADAEVGAAEKELRTINREMAQPGLTQERAADLGAKKQKAEGRLSTARSSVQQAGEAYSAAQGEATAAQGRMQAHEQKRAGIAQRRGAEDERVQDGVAGAGSNFGRNAGRNGGRGTPAVAAEAPKTADISDLGDMPGVAKRQEGTAAPDNTPEPGFGKLKPQEQSQKVYDRFRQNGATHEQAAAYTSAAENESNFNTRAKGDAGTSHGMFQLRDPPRSNGGWDNRATKFQEWAKANGRDPGDWKSQVDYHTHEMKTNPQLKHARQWDAEAAKGGPNALRAAQAAANSYEKPQHWTPGNPWNVHNASGREATTKEFADRFKGRQVQGAYGPGVNPQTASVGDMKGIREQLDARLKSGSLNDADKAKITAQRDALSQRIEKLEAPQQPSGAQASSDHKKEALNREFTSASPERRAEIAKEMSALDKGKAETSAPADGNIRVKMSNGQTKSISSTDATQQKGQAFGGGNTHTGTTSAANAIQSSNNEGVNRFTAFNDNYHAGTGSKHADGLAGDYTLKDGSSEAYAAEAKRINQMFTDAGLKPGRDFRVIDEKNNPSSRATAPHVHYQFQNSDAAARFNKHASENPEFQKKYGTAAKEAQATAAPDQNRDTMNQMYQGRYGNADGSVPRTLGAMKDNYYRNNPEAAKAEQEAARARDVAAMDKAGIKREGAEAATQEGWTSASSREGKQSQAEVKPASDTWQSPSSTSASTAAPIPNKDLRVADNVVPGMENAAGQTATREAQPYGGVVMHVTGHQSMDKQTAFQKQTGYGYQYVVDKEGKVHQMVSDPDSMRTNHIRGAGDPTRSDRQDLTNRNALGIGMITGGKQPTEAQMKAMQQRLPEIYARHGIPTTTPDGKPNYPMGHGEIQGNDPSRNTLGPGRTPEGQVMAEPFRKDWDSFSKSVEAKRGTQATASAEKPADPSKFQGATPPNMAARTLGGFRKAAGVDNEPSPQQTARSKASAYITASAVNKTSVPSKYQPDTRTAPNLRPDLTPKPTTLPSYARANPQNDYQRTTSPGGIKLPEAAVKKADEARAKIREESLGKNSVLAVKPGDDKPKSTANAEPAKEASSTSATRSNPMLQTLEQRGQATGTAQTLEQRGKATGTTQTLEQRGQASAKPEAQPSAKVPATGRAENNVAGGERMAYKPPQPQPQAPQQQASAEPAMTPAAGPSSGGGGGGGAGGGGQVPQINPNDIPLFITDNGLFPIISGIV